MQDKKIHIDAFVSIIDNFGDMGFVLEFVKYFEQKYGEAYSFHIFTNEKIVLQNIFSLNDISQNTEIIDVEDWRKCGDTAIVFLHAEFPREAYRMVFRVDYLSFDSEWLSQNNTEHIASTSAHRIVEYIPSPLPGGAGLLPKISSGISFEEIAAKYHLHAYKKLFSIFSYADTLAKIDFENIPDGVQVAIFGAKNFAQKSENIIVMPFVSVDEMYTIFENSEYIVTRGEVSFMQVLQMGKPFFWDMYHTIGGFPELQSKQFLSFIGASENYKNLSAKIWRGNEKIFLEDMIKTLDTEHENVRIKTYKNLCEEIKNALDKNENSI